MRSPWLTLGAGGAVALGVGLAMAALDGRGFTLQGWMGYSVLLALGLAAVVFVFNRLGRDGATRTVFAVALASMALRLAVGLALARALPVWGYDETAQNLGYVFWDAYKRDTDSWERARSDLPLVASFTAPRSSDQYGGLLFLSAVVYRGVGEEVHRPLLVVVLTAAASALGVLFVWGLGNAVWGRAVGTVAAVVAAFTPEAVLLGASQMREGFLILGLAAALYGYARSRPGAPGGGLIWLVGGLILLMVFSPPTALATAGVVAVAAVWERRGPEFPRWLPWLGGLFAITGLALAVQSWARLEQITGTSWEIVLQWLENAGGGWRVVQAAAGSDQLHATLQKLPEAVRLPFLVAYGVVQPFLPAAIASPGNALWQTIAVIRGLGWFAFIPALIFGTVAAVRKGWRSLEAYLAVLVWVTALLASYRAPGYQWDNPRYRAVFLAVQACLVAWAWVTAGAERSAWLRRSYVSLGLATLIVLHWYLGRRTGLPSLTLEGTVVAAAVAALGYLGAVALADRRQRSEGESGGV